MKKGFTLMELLAVIVILSIIVIIAVPIVINVIDDSEKTKQIISGLNYIDAVEKAIILENNKRQFNPNICIIQTNGNLVCDNEESEIIIEVSGEKPTSGKLVIENSKIISSTSENEEKTKIDFNDFSLSFNEKNKLDLYKEILITSISFSYPKCSESEICVPHVTIKPENATNKKLIFEMESFCTNSCKSTTSASSNYLLIDKDTGELKKIAIPNFANKEGSYHVKITVKTTDGSNLLTSNKIKFYDTLWSCSYPLI